MSQKLPKVVVLLGPTASGKTSLSLDLARKYDAEIIAADSRQIYKKMTIGTAKAPGTWEWHTNRHGLRRSYFVEGVPHHLIDFLDPGKRFTVAEFRDKAVKYIKFAHRNNRIPFVVGGTGLYISALVDNFVIPRVPANKKLRESLEGKTTEELLALLTNLDPKAAQTIDIKNQRRLIRALEVTILTGEPFSEQKKKGDPMFDFLQIGLQIDREVLYTRINTRVDQMVEEGLIDEIQNLLKQKYSWELPSMSGIGYRQFKPYFEKQASIEQCIEQCKKDTRNFARRQITWFKRDSRIHLINDPTQASPLIDQFLAS